MFTNILQVFRNVDDTEHTVEAALGGGLNDISLFVSHAVTLHTYFCFLSPLHQN